nr:pyridoxamine 5'-phosphate oxidase family protein [Mycolicibacterium frederiksbergense]
MRKHHFAVLSTVGEDRSPASAGVCYGMWVCGNEQALYVMTRRHLKKTRNIATNPRVSVVVPLRRRFLRFLPPATIQLHGMAEILDWSDACGTRVFGGFWMGRMILRGYERSRRRGEARICFLRITLDPVIRTYGLGHHVWQLRRHMESGTDTLSFDAGGDSTPPPHRPPESIGNPGHHTT